MDHKTFQLQIQTLVEDLVPQFPEMQFFKEGPNQESYKHNIVAKDSKGLFLKAFTDTPEGRSGYSKEIELIELFNQFSEETDSKFAGPNIVKKVSDPLRYFLMRDIQLDGKFIDRRHKLLQNYMKQVPQEEDDSNPPNYLQ